MMDMSGEYNTALPPEDEPLFQTWAKEHGRLKDLYDYDMRGWWQENVGPPPSALDERETQRAALAYQGVQSMARPDRFAEAVASMPVSKNIEDRTDKLPSTGRIDELGGYIEDLGADLQRESKLNSVVHLTDKFKKPNHPTFSNESQYHGSNGLEGGAWQKQPNGSFVFIPGKTNLENFGPEGLMNYFNQFEVPHGNQLLLPKE